MKVFLLATTLVLSARANATTVQDLTLQCAGHYKVLTATPYFQDNTGTRAPSFAGTHETVQVLDVGGSGCKTFATSYDVSVQVGQVLPYGVDAGESYDKAVELAKTRLGQTFSFAAQQEFGFKEADGTLPLFPLVHEETVFMLGLTGAANTKALYGTPAKSELTDAQIAALDDQAFWHIEWGKLYENLSWGDQWLELALTLQPQGIDAKKEYAQDLVTVFTNASKYSSIFSTSPGVQIGQTLNMLLNELGGTKWATKIAIWNHHPLLFNDQIVSWARFEDGAKKAPLLSPQEVENYLAFAYETVQALKVVHWVNEAQGLIYQFKAAATSIKAASVANGWIPPLYELTPKSQELVDKLIAFQS